MIHYVSIEVNIHGLNERTVERVREAVESQIRELYPRSCFDSDVEVEVIEFAGTEEPTQSDIDKGLA